MRLPLPAFPPGPGMPRVPTPAAFQPIWSPGGREVYFALPETAGPATKVRQRVMRWRVGDREAEEVAPHRREPRLALLSTGQALIWGGGPALAASAQGSAVAIASSQVQHLAGKADLLGVDRAGEVVLEESGREIGALDLSTGAVRRIYP